MVVFYLPQKSPFMLWCMLVHGLTVPRQFFLHLLKSPLGYFASGIPAPEYFKRTCFLMPFPEQLNDEQEYQSRQNPAVRFLLHVTASSPLPSCLRFLQAISRTFRASCPFALLTGDQGFSSFACAVRPFRCRPSCPSCLSLRHGAVHGSCRLPGHTLLRQMPKAQLRQRHAQPHSIPFLRSCPCFSPPGHAGSPATMLPCLHDGSCCVCGYISLLNDKSGVILRKV